MATIGGAFRTGRMANNRYRVCCNIKCGVNKKTKYHAKVSSTFSKVLLSIYTFDPIIN